MWWLVGVLILAASSADARTIRSVLGDSQELVGIRPSAAYSAFASHFVDSASLLTGSTNPTSPVNGIGAAVIDSSMDPLGPIFLDHAQTLGAGATNLNAIGQETLADAALFGQPFSNLGTGPLTVVKRTSTAPPTSPALLGLRLRLHLDLHVWTVAFAVTHGLTDHLDVSLVMPVVSTRLDCALSASVLRASTPDGTFAPAHGARMGTARPVDSTGIGDLVARGKYGLDMPRPWAAAVTLEAAFPTGEVDQIHGTGDYWLTPGVDVSYAVWPHRVEVDAHAAIHVDVVHPERSQALYGVSASAVLWPKRLAGIVEFVGTSQFTSTFAPTDTNTLTWSGSFQQGPLFGVDWSQRVDTFDFSFGLRAAIQPWLVLFANGTVPLNDSVIRPAGVIPTVGVGGTF